jgi:hypothetical protein
MEQLKTHFGQVLEAHTCNPATQEAEIRKIVVQSQPGQVVHETLSRKNCSQKRLVEWLEV